MKYTQILLLSILYILTTQPSWAQGLSTVVLDAGHGGHDAGNTGTGRYKKSEKDISLEVVLKIGKYIEEAFPEVKVIYTRKDDRFIPLNERSQIANRSRADLFISVHCNAASATSARGTETFVMGLHRSKANLDVAMRENSTILMEDNYENTYQDFNPNDPDNYIAMSLMQSAYLDKSLTLAAKVQDDFTTRLGRYNRGVKQAGFLVLYKSTMPAILVELGFLTNAEEEEFLHSENGKDYMASAIFRAFRVYKESYDANAGLNAKSNEEGAKDNSKLYSNDKSATNSLPLEPYFTIQLLSSRNKVALNSPLFKGVDNIIEKNVEERYKYSFGEYTNYKDAKNELENFKKKGFNSPFIVAYLNNKPISLEEALKLSEKSN